MGGEDFPETLMAFPTASAPLARRDDAAAVSSARRAPPQDFVAVDPRDFSPQNPHRAPTRSSQPAKGSTQVAARGFTLSWNAAGSAAGTSAPTTVSPCNRSGTEEDFKAGRHKSFESGFSVASTTAAPRLSILHCKTEDSCRPKSASDLKIQAKESSDPSSTAFWKQICFLD